jgi:hypothetical protein
VKRNQHQRLITFFSFCIQQGWIEKNPAKGNEPGQNFQAGRTSNSAITRKDYSQKDEYQGVVQHQDEWGWNEPPSGVASVGAAALISVTGLGKKEVQPRGSCVRGVLHEKIRRSAPTSEDEYQSRSPRLQDGTSAWFGNAEPKITIIARKQERESFRIQRITCKGTPERGLAIGRCFFVCL